MKDTLARIRRMELYFDALQTAFAEDPALLRDDPCFAPMLRALTDYYESPLWRADYALDEEGALPADLKRGVLSQDGVYTFLSALQDASL